MEINYVLIASIAIVALSTYIGFRKGLLLTVYSAGAMLIAIALAYILMPYGTKLLKQTGIYDVVYEKVNDAVNDVMGSGDTDNKGEQAEAIDSMEVPGYTKDVLHDNNNSKVYDMMESTGFRDYVDNSVTIMIMNAISALIIFLVIFIIIRIIGMFLKFLRDVPIIHGVDRTGGMLLGFLRGMLILWIACVVIAMIPTTPAGKYIFDQIEKSSVLTWIYDNNFLMAAVRDLGRIIS
ncbi:MAG: CvpA family protein [Lachnospiraceae bacterium]|nr:CvpA family protein [Lachnospiraceae bacterium]